MKREERVIMSKVIKLKFGEYGVNEMMMGEWRIFDDWYGIVDIMDRKIKESLEEGKYKDWVEENEEVNVICWGDYVKDLCRWKGDEESELVFNIEKMEGKVIKLNGENGDYEFVEDKDISWMLGWNRGKIEKLEYVVLMEERGEYYKVVKWEEVKKSWRWIES